MFMKVVNFTVEKNISIFRLFVEKFSKESLCFHRESPYKFMSHRRSYVITRIRRKRKKMSA
jgi:hypothetical protein